MVVSCAQSLRSRSFVCYGSIMVHHNANMSKNVVATIFSGSFLSGSVLYFGFRRNFRLTGGEIRDTMISGLSGIYIGTGSGTDINGGCFTVSVLFGGGESVFSKFLFIGISTIALSYIFGGAPLSYSFICTGSKVGVVM